MPETRPDLPAVTAVAVTVCPLLAAHLVALHPGLRTGALTRLAGAGTLRDTDGLLLLSHHDPAAAHADPNTGRVTTTIYLGTDPDDATVWARAARLRAHEVLVLPQDDEQLTARLTWHLGAVA